MTNDVNHDVDVENRVKNFTINMKQQADQLVMSSKYEEAIRIYRELLMQLTKSQVEMVHEKDVVLSCRMNILAAMCKMDQWRDIPKECGLVLDFIHEIETVQDNQICDGERTRVDVQIVGRVYYFRGLSYFRMCMLQAADADLRKAMQLLPNLESIRDHWKQVQGAMKSESKGNYGKLIQKNPNIVMNNSKKTIDTCQTTV